VNVQHIESLNDIVAKITGVVVRETVPDSMLEQADEIELIDLPPDDLLQRLKEGKVYLADQAGRAGESFFKKGNLVALRELALRRTAERVHAQVQDYRQRQSSTVAWPTSERLLVCIGPSPFSARLVRSTRRMAAGLHCPWFAVSIETPAQATLSDAGMRQLQDNFRLATQLGAQVASLPSASIVAGLLSFAREKNITKIVIGKSRPRWKDRLFGSLVDELIRQSGDIDIYVINGDDEGPQEHVASDTGGRSVHWQPNMIVLALTIGATLIGYGMKPFFELSNIIMIYLLCVVAVASWLGRGPAILTSILSVAAFDFFFVPPHLTFAVADTQYLVTFAVMLIVGIVISTLTASVRQLAMTSAAREQRTAALYAMSRELASSRGTATLLHISVRHIASVFDCDVAGLLAESSGRLEIRAGDAVRFPLDDRERGVAQWVLDTGQIAGLGTKTLPSAIATYIPLRGTAGCFGVMGVHPRNSAPFSPEQLLQLESFCSQAALALECDRLAEEARKAQVTAESEKSRNALLSTVSHDLRTPLAAISGASSSLLLDGSRQSETVRRELAETIHAESERLGRLVANLLEMTKLQSGTVALKREPCPIDEFVGSALGRLDAILGGRKIETRIDSELPLAEVDALLLEQVFINVIENAHKYSDAKSAINISARLDGAHIRVEVADRGPGVPENERTDIFERFTRGTNARNQRGSGLGLAIAKAVIEAHGGRIGVTSREGGGAVFWFTVPASTSPGVILQESNTDA
jgi:two-component system, OmpR family, sensor histidine kinase KdpD